MRLRNLRKSFVKKYTFLANEQDIHITKRSRSELFFYFSTTFCKQSLLKLTAIRNKKETINITVDLSEIKYFQGVLILIKCFGKSQKMFIIIWYLMLCHETSSITSCHIYILFMK